MGRLRNFLCKPKACEHKRTRGVANYFVHDLHIFLHLVQCEDCGLAIIEETP